MFDLISISEAIKQSYASKGLLVDVRSEEAFKKGHLPMAVNIPFTDIMKEKFDIEADFNVEKNSRFLCIVIQVPQVYWQRESWILWEFTHIMSLVGLCFIKDIWKKRRMTYGRWCVLLDTETFPKYNYNY